MVTDTGTRDFNGLHITWELDCEEGTRETPPSEDYTITAEVLDLNDIECSFDEESVKEMFSDWKAQYNDYDGKWMYKNVPEEGEPVELPDSVRESIREILR